MTTLADFLALDDALANHGVPPEGDWWRAEALRYFDSGALTWLVCAGRGSAKSHTLYKLALCEALFGSWEVPPGERHWALISSRHKDEVAKCISIVSRWCRLLGVAHSPTGDAIELADLPLGIRVSAANVGGNSGWRAFFDGNDEVAKWQTEGAVGVDAVEVLASKRAMTTTHARARHVLMSTPFLSAGPFHDAFAAGSNALQVVSHAPTWVATDGRITEATTRELEPNERVWRREYAAEPADEWGGSFFGGLVAPCVAHWPLRPRVDGESLVYRMSVDPAFSRDLFAVAVAHLDAGQVVVDRVDAIAPPSGGKLSPLSCIRQVLAIRDEYGARGPVLTDQYSAEALRELAAGEGLDLESVPWSAQNKASSFELMRTMMRDQRVTLPNDPGLLRELSGVSTRLMPSGYETVGARSGFTDDRTSAVVQLVASLARPEAGTRMVRGLAALIARGGVDVMAAELADGLARDQRVSPELRDHAASVLALVRRRQG